MWLLDLTRTCTVEKAAALATAPLQANLRLARVEATEQNPLDNIFTGYKQIETSTKINTRIKTKKQRQQAKRKSEW